MSKNLSGEYPGTWTQDGLDNPKRRMRLRYQRSWRVACGARTGFETLAILLDNGSTPLFSAYMVFEVKLVRRCAVTTVTMGSRPINHPYGELAEW